MPYLSRLKQRYSEIASDEIKIDRPYPNTYHAFLNGVRVGELNLATRGPYATSVTVEQRRSGVATALYAAAEKDLGRPMIPSPLGMSLDAQQFWKARLSKLPYDEKQKLLAESLAIGIKAGIGNSARKRMVALGYKDVT